jgi:hypothetical protein
MRKRVLFICGSINQTTQMHKIASELPEYDHYFTPYYADRIWDLARKLGLAEFTVMGRMHSDRCLAYLNKHGLKIDTKGRRHRYDLVATCSDLIVPSNTAGSKLVLVQEGMTDPETILYHVVRSVRILPRWLASTAATGLSDEYDRFCVASYGYRDLFIRRGVKPRKIVVTGIPNFDNCRAFLENDFPHKGFVLVCTSDTRETFKRDDRSLLIQKALRIAAGRQLIFKLHPNERIARSTGEILKAAPEALIYSSGSAEEMIANCDVLITQYSSTAYVGLALGKEVHSCFEVEELKRLMPLQNGSAARNIANVCHNLMEGLPVAEPHGVSEARASVEASA